MKGGLDNGKRFVTSPRQDVGCAREEGDNRQVETTICISFSVFKDVAGDLLAQRGGLDRALAGVLAPGIRAGAGGACGCVVPQRIGDGGVISGMKSADFVVRDGGESVGEEGGCQGKEQRRMRHIGLIIISPCSED